MMRRLCLVGLLALVAMQGTVFSMEQPREFRQALEHYRGGRYDQTAEILRQYLKDHGKEKATEYVVPLMLEALVRERDHQTFTKLAKIYRKKFPRSDFLPRLHYLEGMVLAREERFVPAVEAFSSALVAGARDPLDSLSAKNVRLICDKGLAVEELGRLAARSDLDRRVLELVAYFEFKKLNDLGQVARARKTAERFRKRFPRSPFNTFARDLVETNQPYAGKSMRIGLLAPLSGYDSEIGRQIVQGVQLAVDEFSQEHKIPVELIIRDTRANMVETVHQTKELLDKHKVPLIIGPILSQTATAAAAMVMERDAVMITPTATDEGIAGLGENIFQLNVTLGVLGRRIAEYAMNNLNMKEFAIIAPMSDYGTVLSENFKKAVTANGGIVVAEEHFDEGASDFRSQFESLRHKLMIRRKEKLAAEQGMDYVMNGGLSRQDSLSLVDSVLAVDGLFLPAESEDVVMLAPQVYFHQVRAQLLGSTGWHTPSTILDGKKYVNNAIISTSFQIDPAAPTWVAFSKKYRDRFNMEPDRIVSPLAYDAAALSLSAIARAGDDNPKKIARYLKGVRKHHGVCGLVSFAGSDGANTETAILKISNREFTRLE
jgi:ABC-type branched-subunit amino acid transport system substrate-binding protein